MDFLLAIAAILFLLLVAIPVWKKHVKQEPIREMFEGFQKGRR